MYHYLSSSFKDEFGGRIQSGLYTSLRTLEINGFSSDIAKRNAPSLHESYSPSRSTPPHLVLLDGCDHFSTALEVNGASIFTLSATAISKKLKSTFHLPDPAYRPAIHERMFAIRHH